MAVVCCSTNKFKVQQSQLTSVAAFWFRFPLALRVGKLHGPMDPLGVGDTPLSTPPPEGAPGVPQLPEPLPPRPFTRAPVTPESITEVHCADCGLPYAQLASGSGQAWCELCAGTWRARRRALWGVPAGPERDRARAALRELETAIEAALVAASAASQAPRRRRWVFATEAASAASEAPQASSSTE